MTESIGSATRRGFAWSILASVSVQIASVAATILLARLLAPREFGIYAATLLFTEVGSTLVSSGFVSALILRQDVTEREYATTLGASFAASLVLAAAIVLGAGWAAAYYREPEVRPVLSALSLSMLALPFTSVPSAMLRKQLRFGALATGEILASLANSVVAVGCALLGLGVWSLVWGKVAANVFRAGYMMIAARWRPRFALQRSALRALTPSISLFATKNVLNDVATNVPYTLVGRLLGPAALGFYSRADSLVALPISKLAGPFGVVLFPALSQIRSDPEVLRRFVLQSLCGLSLLAFPAVAGLLAVADSFVPVVLGPVWLPMVAPLQILCVAGLILALEPVVISALHATGYLAQEVGRQLIYLILLVLGVGLGARFGTTGVAVAMLVVTAIHMTLLVFLIRRVLALPAARLGAAVAPALFYTALMLAAVLAARLTLARWIEPETAPALLAQVAAGALVYGLGASLLRPPTRDPLALEVVEGFRARVRRVAAILGWRGGTIREPSR